MILPKKVFRPLILPFGLVLFLNRVLIGGIVRSFSRESMDRDTRGIFFPELKLNANGKTSCISCSLCLKICPTQCLSIEGEYGSSPTNFSVETTSCVSCQLCKQICPVDALASIKI